MVNGRVSRNILLSFYVGKFHATKVVNNTPWTGKPQTHNTTLYLFKPC